MRTFKTRWFHKWALEEGLKDESLRAAIREMNHGLVDADLGDQVMKKRVALPGRGKRGGSRTLVAFKRDECAFFVFGFAKNERANVSDKQLRALKRLAIELLGYPESEIARALGAAELIEVNENG